MAKGRAREIGKLGSYKWEERRSLGLFQGTIWKAKAVGCFGERARRDFVADGDVHFLLDDLNANARNHSQDSAPWAPARHAKHAGAHLLPLQRSRSHALYVTRCRANSRRQSTSKDEHALSLCQLQQTGQAKGEGEEERCPPFQRSCAHTHTQGRPANANAGFQQCHAARRQSLMRRRCQVLGRGGCDWRVSLHVAQSAFTDHAAPSSAVLPNYPLCQPYVACRRHTDTTAGPRV